MIWEPYDLGQLHMKMVIQEIVDIRYVYNVGKTPMP